MKTKKKTTDIAARSESLLERYGRSIEASRIRVAMDIYRESVAAADAHLREELEAALTSAAMDAKVEGNFTVGFRPSKREITALSAALAGLRTP